LGEWAVQNGIKINPGKSKAIRFTTARVKNPLGYFLGYKKIPGSEQLEIILRSDLSLWPWKWTFKYWHIIYVKCEYFMNQKTNVMKYTTFCRGIN
jgi:hypothetical protein